MKNYVVVWLFQQNNKRLLRITKREDLQNIDEQSLRFPEGMHLPNYFLRNVFSSSNNLLWWYHKEGQGYFIVFDPHKGVVTDLQSKLKPFFSYKSPLVDNIYFDEEDRVWAATEDGIFIIKLKKKIK